ncbi:MAG: hypothetical protein ACRCVJ_04570 [Clostridium sp.]|uniref:hypothetical protein n=1 Tax=Clostridium sp. TaxID=1506 RepID=UPI003F4022EA
MKKIFITSFLAITMSTAFYFIVFWEPDSYNPNASEKDVVLNEEKNKKEENKVENNSNTNTDNKTDLNKKSNENKNEVKENNIDNKEDNSKTEEKPKVETETKEENKDEQKEVVSNNITIFNVKKEEIIDRLTFKEKTKLLSVANKMSAVDVERIKESLMNKGEKEGSVEALKVIKRRLTTEDYKDVKDILSPYINIDLLESIV